MSALRPVSVRFLTVVPLVLALAFTMLATWTVSPATPKASAVTVATGDRAGDLARGRRGSPYRYGADGPYRFDCSGLTRWVYAKLGRSLPHSSRLQVAKTVRVSRANARRGDLVFFYNANGVYHVGIKAYGSYIWHAPYSGARVRKEHIWTSKVFFGRVR